MLNHVLSTTLLLLATGAASAQPSSLSVSLAGGYRPTSAYICQPGPENEFYPELQIESKFGTFGDQTLSAHGAAYYAYWDDGVSEMSEVTLCSDGDITYSISEHTAGIRLFIAGEKGFLPVAVSTGLARQFFFSDYIGGESWGVKGHNYSSVYTTAEVGLHVRVPIGAKLKFQGGVRRYVRIPTRQHIIGAFIEDARRVYQFGIAYRLL